MRDLTTITTSGATGPTRRAVRRVTGLDIIVLAGGPGAEREVSLESGRAR